MAPETPAETPGNFEQLEKGANVKILLKFLRHGERQGEMLTDLGRRITRERAREKRLEYDDFDAVKAVGSDSGPKGPTGMQRSLETAHIYGKEIPQDREFSTRARKILSPDTLKTPPPYDHFGVYNSHLPPDFATLPDADKVSAARKAQTATMNHLMSLESEQAIRYKMEMAGAYATFVEHHAELAKRLKSGSRVLIPAGTHGGVMEFLLQQALVWEDEGGARHVGFTRIEDIGGGVNPSEAYNVEVATDKNGELKDMIVSFDDPSRLKLKNMRLEPEKVRELTKFYATLHNFEPDENTPEEIKEPLDFIEREDDKDILFRRGSCEVSLKRYLPEGWKFQRVATGRDYGQHEVHFDERTVKYNKGELENKESREYALASVLHELGHLENELGERRPENEPSAELAKAHKPHMYDVGWFNFIIATERLPLEEIKAMPPEKLKEKVTEFIKADDALKEKFLDSAKELYKNERGAWARALEWLREFQNDGLETRATREELLKYVHTRLGTYEKSLLDELKEYGLEKSDVARDIEKKRKATSADLIEEDFRQFAKKFGVVD